MTQRGATQATSIQAELSCPQCSYSLRGLPGDVITCPECGATINLANLIAARWRGPWYYAPLYNVLALPLAWGFFAFIASIVTLLLTFEGETPSRFMFLGLFAVIAIVWFALLAMIFQRFGSIEGVWLALLLHAVFVCYVVSIAGVVGVCVKLVFDFATRPWLVIADVLWLAIGVGAFVGAKLSERFVGRRCIRRHLRICSAGDTMAA